MEELWKDIGIVKGVDLSGLYQISNLGRVKSLERYDVSGRLIREKILKPCPEHYGYLVVTLCTGTISKVFKVHRLVAEAFIPNPNNLPQINHKDEDKTNNNVNNLEWCTSEYNANYGTRNERISDKNIGRIITEEQKKKQSEKMSGENHPFYGKKRPKHSERMKGEKNPFFGKTHTEETKKKISETRNKKPVAQIDKATGEIIKTFSSLAEVNSTLGFDGSFISACCKGKHSTAYGFKWSFV